METELSKKYLVKEVPQRPAQTERGLQWFKTSFWLPDNSTTNSYCLRPKKGGWSYRRRVISNKQSNKTLNHSSTSTEQLKRYTTVMQHLLQAFLPKQHLMVVWLNRVIIILCLRFCYIKDIRIYIMIWIIHSNVATKITHLQKNIVALKKPTTPSPDSKVPLSFWNLAPKATFFLAHTLLPGGGEGEFYATSIQITSLFFNNGNDWIASTVAFPESPLGLKWHHGVMIITTTQLHLTKAEFRFCTGSNPACDMLDIPNGEDLWQWSQLEIRLNAFHRSTILQNSSLL